MKLSLALSLLAVSVTHAALPLKQVVLFDSGVGYFERSDTVKDGDSIEMTFTSDQMMDVIKSLLILDGKGGAPTVTYDARDPLDRTLRAFRIYLGDNPERHTLLNRLRGVPVRVKVRGGEAVEGTVVGAEMTTVRDDEDTFERWFLNLSVDGVIHTMDFDTMESFEVLDEGVREDIAKSLELMAANLDQGKKAMRLTFGEGGSREVRLGYLLEAPVWKTSYRLNIEEKSVFLQGWAHVENTSDEDWKDIALSLVSGKPLSFVQNLYDPLYVKRPVVENDVGTSAPPPVYQDAMEAFGGEGDMLMAAESAAPAAAPAPMRFSRMAKGIAPQEMQPQVKTREAGELFEYAIDKPLTLPRQQSAMVPIVNQSVKGRSLSIFNEGVNDVHPLNGVELENTSGLSLKGGPITVIEAGIYAGDARIADLMAGDKRLLSFSIDLSRDVRVERDSKAEEIVSVKIQRGAVTTSRKLVQDTTYVIRNKGKEARTVIVEHPRRQGWELGGERKADEETPELYRFFSDVPVATAPSKLAVREVQIQQQSMHIGQMDPASIGYYLNQKVISAGVREALSKAAALQAQAAKLEEELRDLEQRYAAIERDQTRIRENMNTVSRTSDTYTKWERKLAEQEEAIYSIQTRREQAGLELRQKQAERDEFLSNLNLE